MSIRAAIVGPTGYTGQWLIELLLAHPSAELTLLASRREQPPHIAEEFPRFVGRIPDGVALARPIDPDVIGRTADVAFLAMPSRAAMDLAPKLRARGVRVIDLSADYRLRDAAVYDRAYGRAHEDLEGLSGAVYGLPELDRAHLPEAGLVANPGCYPTSAALAAAPLLAEGLVRREHVIVDSASGVTGAGRSPAPHLHFPELNESFFAYGTIGAHRHQPEIEQSLRDAAGAAVPVLFVPHLLPIDRGILSTVYLEPVEPVSEDRLYEAIEGFAEREPFIRVRSELPNVKHTRGTNFCDIAVRRVAGDEERPERVVVFSALDNMVKGASGQAIQNMNAMFGLAETAGLL